MNQYLAAVLERRRPGRIPYAPNYWQWYQHQSTHGALPAELAGCGSQLEVLEHLGVDVFSRNLYPDYYRGFWGGLSDEVWKPEVQVECRESCAGRDRMFERTYRTPAGALTERQHYVFAETTLVQEKFLVDDHATQLDALEALLRARTWQFRPERYRQWSERVGPEGCVIAGEIFSPLKLLHVLLNPINTTYLLADYPERARELLAIHEAAMLDLTRQMAEAGVRVMMSMDNIDTAFHTPPYVEKYSASFYQHAARICHQHGSLLFIHACGQQRGNLKLLAELGVDGLEGVAFPPLGDVQMEEALELSGDRFIVTGGISSMEFLDLHTREEVFAYTRNLFARVRPYTHRFIFSSSCNTPYTAAWERIVDFRDAWREYGQL